MWNSDISTISGVGEARKKQLARLDVHTVGDMLYFFPRKFEDRSSYKKVMELIDGDTASLKLMVLGNISERRIRKGLTVYTLSLGDDSGLINGVWFNNPYIKNALKKDKLYSFYGKISIKYGKKEIENPVFEIAEENKYIGKIIPIYHLTADLTQKTITNIMYKCLSDVNGKVPETLPFWIRKENNLAEIKFSFRNIHFPSDFRSYEIARRRFVFEEFFLLQTGLRMLKGRRESINSVPISGVPINEFEKRLPFELTSAQKRVINEIYDDLKGTKQMNRLVQGDVGSGKTAVAASAIYAAIKNGYQAAMMAPTEILANQHYESLCKIFYDFNIVLLTGSLTGKAKKDALEKIKNGTAQIVIGTHSLIEGATEFKNLGLTITDEQHRFGVIQRAQLSFKGIKPHVLVMSATPIPRTLSLVLYGDLDVSIIDELPPGRQKIETFMVNENMRDRVYSFIKKETDSGRQAYIVCPLVEESEKLTLKSVMEFTKMLSEKYFTDGQISFIHGKLKSSEKDQIMSDFTSGKTKILVSTTVIEVGVNVPSATIMIIENAERFGLSQLHQLRGRVGRGSDKSYCILFTESHADVTKKRMDIMKETNDGFKIAEKDLEIRGPGDFFGTKQHGLPELKIANIFTDTEIMKQAGLASNKLLTLDPTLSNPENQELVKRIKLLFNQNKGSFN